MNGELGVALVRVAYCISTTGDALPAILLGLSYVSYVNGYAKRLGLEPNFLSLAL